MTRYTTWGPVRGSCGHRHRNIGAAIRCAERDYRDVRRVNGGSSYSDRGVRRWAESWDRREGPPALQSWAEEEEAYTEEVRLARLWTPPTWRGDRA